MRAWAIDERAILMRQNSELKSANGKIGRFLTSLTRRFRKFSSRIARDPIRAPDKPAKGSGGGAQLTETRRLF
jgi:hypothetical protein